MSHIPKFHYNPKVRLKKALSLSGLHCEPFPPLKRYRFQQIIGQARKKRELIYDPITNIVPRGMSFSGDFEGGNIGSVWRIAPKTYEIRMLPDPTRMYSATWFFFRVDNITPGDYTFVISGFFRDAQLHYLGVQPTALSMNNLRKGLGWERIGTNLNFWCSKKSTIAPEYSFSFSFTVKERDTMYFSYLYPYNYTDMRNHLNEHGFPFTPICKSYGGVDVPAVLWDADEQRFKRPASFLLSKEVVGMKKPLIVIASRLHPGESNSSYAMESFMNTLFSGKLHSVDLLSNFSFLMLPMMNPDGVICGYYRPQINGYDMNRVWKRPDKYQHPEAFHVVRLIDHLVRNRPLLFLLDFHGHTAQCNAFTYGVRNPSAKLNEYESLFPKLMGDICDIFDTKESTSLSINEYTSTMRVALHQRYGIPFAYTLEMSFGGCLIGSQTNHQMTEDSYRRVGSSTVEGIYQFLRVHCPIADYISMYSPPNV